VRFVNNHINTTDKQNLFVENALIHAPHDTHYDNRLVDIANNRTKLIQKDTSDTLTTHPYQQLERELHTGNMNATTTNYDNHTDASDNQHLSSLHNETTSIIHETHYDKKLKSKTPRQLQRQIEIEQIRNIIKKGKESKNLQQSITQRHEKEQKTDNKNTTIINNDKHINTTDIQKLFVNNAVIHAAHDTHYDNNLTNIEINWTKLIQIETSDALKRHLKQHEGELQNDKMHSTITNYDNHIDTSDNPHLSALNSETTSIIHKTHHDNKLKSNYNGRDIPTYTPNLLDDIKVQQFTNTNIQISNKKDNHNIEIYDTSPNNNNKENLCNNNIISSGNTKMNLIESLSEAKPHSTSYDMLNLISELDNLPNSNLNNIRHTHQTNSDFNIKLHHRCGLVITNKQHIQNDNTTQQTNKGNISTPLQNKKKFKKWWR
jgi:hypothetical protein